MLYILLIPLMVTVGLIPLYQTVMNWCWWAVNWFQKLKNTCVLWHRPRMVPTLLL